MKSDSTKENKSLKLYGSNSIKDHSKKINHIKSSLSREKFDQFAINVGNDCPASEFRPKDKKKLKKKKSKHNLNLIERAKKRD